ncbi:MAG TPA: MtrB/PioB family outer membrane beta-barrel protein, partial [Caldimonas sp.]
IPATPLPTVKTDTIELKLGARYAVSTQQTVRVGYTFQHMTSTDWAYDALQFGGLTGGLPTGQQPYHFNVSTIAVAYIYSFR